MLKIDFCHHKTSVKKILCIILLAYCLASLLVNTMNQQKSMKPVAVMCIMPVFKRAHITNINPPIKIKLRRQMSKKWTAQSSCI